MPAIYGNVLKLLCMQTNRQKKKGAGRPTEKMKLIGAFSECSNVPKTDS